MTFNSSHWKDGEGFNSMLIPKIMPVHEPVGFILPNLDICFRLSLTLSGVTKLRRKPI